MKNLTAAVLLSGFTFVALSSAEDGATAATSTTQDRPRETSAPLASCLHQRRLQATYSVSTCGSIFSRAPGNTAEGPSNSARV
jgi:hypothetical protein